MSMDEFIKTLSEEQKQALLKALSGDNLNTEAPDEPLNTHPPFIDDSRWQHEEPISEAVDGPQDFTMNKQKESEKISKQPVRARENQWTDTGEDRHIETPQVAMTPRNRQPPKMKKVTCTKCGTTETVNESVLCGEFYRCSRCVR